VVCGHAAGLAATEFCEDGADADIVYFGGIEVGELCERGFENLRVLVVYIWCGIGWGGTYSAQHLVVIGIAESTLLCAGYGRAQCGENDDVVGGLLEDVLEAFLDERHREERYAGGILRTFGGMAGRLRKVREVSRRKSVASRRGNMPWQSC
jgi:hypothetical protein